MQLINMYSNGDRTARIFVDSISGYVVEYLINDKRINKTYHNEVSLAEAVADDFIAEAGNTPTLLNE